MTAVLLKKSLTNVLLLLGSFTVGFGLAEATLRTLGYHGEPSMVVENTIMIEDEILNWRFLANTEFYYDDITYQINERGFRDNLYSFEKGNNVFRIFLAGDSVAFGTNVNLTDTYPKVLETRLNELNMPYRFEVLSHAMPGLSFKQKVHLVQQYAAPYDPDLIIVDYVLNDIAFDSRKNLEKEKDTECSVALIQIKIPCALESGIKNSAFIVHTKNMIEKVLDQMHWEDQNDFYKRVSGDFYQKLYADPNRITSLKAHFAQLGIMQQQTRIPIYIPSFPIIYDFGNYQWAEIHKLIESLCEKHDLLFVSILEDFRKYDYRDMRVIRGDFDHPSVKGHKVAAEAILNKIIDEFFLFRAPLES